VATEHGVVGGNSLADREPLGAYPDRIDVTDDLMARRQRILREEATVVDMNVGPAHAGHLDREPDLSRARLRRWDRADFKLPWSAIDDGFHIANTTNAVYEVNTLTTCVCLVLETYKED
jgi:hypothetical protein